MQFRVSVLLHVLKCLTREEKTSVQREVDVFTRRLAKTGKGTNTYRTRRTRQAVAWRWPSLASVTTSLSRVVDSSGLASWRARTPYIVFSTFVIKFQAERRISELTAMLFLRSD